MRGNRQAARQGAEVNDEIAARQIPEAPGRVAQDDVEVPVLTTRELRQNVEVAGETQASGVETTGRAEGGIGEATPVPSSTLPSPDQEESVVAEEPSLGRKASPAAGAMELSPPPEVSDVNLPSPSPVPPLPDEPTAQTARGEKPRIYVRSGTAAARRKAEELNVDLDEIEGTAGQITVGDVTQESRREKP